jgi:DNA-binding NtrC family response regulator
MRRPTEVSTSSEPGSRIDHNLLPPDALAFARMAARCSLPILLHGETGSGKTHLARLIHEFSSRAGKPFVRVNCAAIPETLFERELFGHVRGAFTDARDPGVGFVEAADTGTLFLDEFGELTGSIQPKLLALLEEGKFRKLGSPREVTTDIRFVFATHRDLSDMVRRREFREDLFYRCSTLQFSVRPLRARRADLPAIVTGLLAKWALPGERPSQVTGEAIASLQAHAWPGNFRELENVLRGALMYADGAPILSAHLQCMGAPPSSRPAGPVPRHYVTPDDSADEARVILEALRLEGGSRGRAAKRLGMSRATLWTKLQRYPELLGDLADLEAAVRVRVMDRAGPP